MKGFMVILLIAIFGVGYWGYSQSNAKVKAIKEVAETKKEVSQVESESKKLESIVENQKNEIANLKNTEKMLNAKLLLHKENVEVLENKVSSLEKDKKELTGKLADLKSSNNNSDAESNSGEHISFGSKRSNESSSRSSKVSSKVALQVTELKHKIKLLDNQIENYQSRARNVKYAIIEMDKDDRKGWNYKKSDPKRYVRPLSTLPHDWNLRTVRIIYISKDEKRAKMKKEYLNKIAELERQKAGLVSQLTDLQK